MPFSNLTLPTISGSAAVGDTLVVNSGTWSPTPGSLLHQWQNATVGTGPYTNISGATGNTYVVATSDLAKYIRVAETPVAFAASNQPLSIWNDNGNIQSTFSHSGAWQYAVAQQPWASGDAVWAIANAGCPVLIYTNFQDIPDPSASDPTGLGNGVSYNDAVSNNWFVAGGTSSVTGGGPTFYEGAVGTPNQVLGDITNSSYISKFISNLIAECHSIGAAGIHIDNIIENGAYVMTGGACGVEQSVWHSGHLAALTSICTAFHAASPALKVGCNINAYGSVSPNQYTDTGGADRVWFDDVLATGIDFAFREYWLFNGNGALYLDYGPTTNWLALQTDAQAAGVAFIGHPGYGTAEGNPDNISNTQRERYAKAAFLIQWDGGLSTFTSCPADGTWLTDYGYVIGAPSGPIGGYGVGSGGLARTYVGAVGSLAGLVLWNPTSSSQSFLLPTGTWENQAAQTGIVGSVTVGGYDGMFLNRTA